MTALGIVAGVCKADATDSQDASPNYLRRNEAVQRLFVTTVTVEDGAD